MGLNAWAISADIIMFIMSLDSFSLFLFSEIISKTKRNFLNPWNLYLSLKFLTHPSIPNNKYANICLSGSFNNLSKLFLLKSLWVSYNSLNYIYFISFIWLLICTIGLQFYVKFCKYLISELICYFIYNTRFFCFKILIIENIKLVPVNIVIDKPILYW